MHQTLHPNCTEDLEELVKLMCSDIATMIWHAGSGHYGGSVSIAPALAVIGEFFNINPFDLNRDNLILSKGHACPALYSYFARKGHYPLEHLLKLRQLDSPISGHPDMTKFPVFISTGSLGMGLADGLGAAIASNLENRDAYTIVILGDGETQEGMILEARELAGELTQKYNLGRLIVFCDYNKFGLDGLAHPTKNVDQVASEWGLNNWNTRKVNGFYIPELRHTVSGIKRQAGLTSTPTIVFLDTVKGRWFPRHEGRASSHSPRINRQDLDEILNAIFGSDLEGYKSSGKLLLGREEPKEMPRFPINNPETRIEVPDDLVEGVISRYKEKGATPAEALNAFLEGVLEINEKILVVDADLRPSFDGRRLAERYPNRCIDVGLREQTGAGIAAGIAASGLGYYPLFRSFGNFSAIRPAEPIMQQIAIPGLNALIIGRNAGVRSGEDGITHCSLHDISVMLPLMTVFEPGEFYSFVYGLRDIFRNPQQIYLRLTRTKLPVLEQYKNLFRDLEFGHAVLLDETEGERRDVAIISSGLIENALKAGEILDKEGISVNVIYAPALPIANPELIQQTVKCSGLCCTVEDHWILYGLGSYIADLLAETGCPIPLQKMAIESYKGGGDGNAALEGHRLHPEGIAKRIMQRYRKVA